MLNILNVNANCFDSQRISSLHLCCIGMKADKIICMVRNGIHNKKSTFFCM